MRWCWPVIFILVFVLSNISCYNDPRIIGGAKSPNGTYMFLPNLVYVHERQNMSYAHCSSTVISKRHILTAAHCIIGKSESKSITMINRRGYFLVDHPPKAKVVFPLDFNEYAIATKIYFHPSYYPGKRKLFDIAVVEFPDETKFDIEPVTLINNYLPKDGDFGVAAGYGRMRGRDGKLRSSPYLQNTTVRIFTKKTCGLKNKFIELCAGNRAHMASKGDSGGPLFINQNETFYQIGVTSWGGGAEAPKGPAHDEEEDVLRLQTTQNLCNLSETLSPTPRKSLTNKDKQEIVRKWKSGVIKSKPTLKGNYAQILEGDTVVGHICVHCEKFFIGKIGGSQRQHACEKPPPVFSSAQKEIAKKACLTMIKTDLNAFAIVQKPGFLEYTKSMLRLGAELGVQDVQNLASEDLKNLLPHPTTLSNHINILSTRKVQLYAILKRKGVDSGFSLLVDGTSKSYHYTGLTMAFIDDDWICQTVLWDLISGHGKGEAAAAYTSEKAKEFLNSFGMDINLLNAYVTDEAAAMKAAFGTSKRQIICACHTISTICKHSIVLYAKDRETFPWIHESLKVVLEYKKMLKELVTAVKGRIFINKSLSNPLYQSNETRFLSFTTSLNSFLSLKDEDHELINKELSGHAVYPSYLKLVEGKQDLITIYNALYPTNSVLRSLEADKDPTLHLVVPAFARLFEIWSEREDETNDIEYSLKTAALLALQEKVPLLHDYHYFAILLDPNAKSNINKFIIPDRDGKKRMVEELIPKFRLAVKEYVIQTRKYRPHPTTISSSNPFAHLVSIQEDSPDVILNAEIDKYLLDQEEYESSILKYWKKASIQYPYLSSFAKMILSIPASSCPLERSFSVLNKVDCKERPQLNQETISNIVVCNAMERFMPGITVKL